MAVAFSRPCLLYTALASPRLDPEPAVHARYSAAHLDFPQPQALSLHDQPASPQLSPSPSPRTLPHTPYTGTPNSVTSPPSCSASCVDASCLCCSAAPLRVCPGCWAGCCNHSCCSSWTRGQCPRCCTGPTCTCKEGEDEVRDLPPNCGMQRLLSISSMGSCAGRPPARAWLRTFT